MGRQTGKIPMDCTFQVGHAPVKMVSTNRLLHLAPDRLDRIQPWRIGGQKVKLEAARVPLQIALHLAAEMDGVIVQHQVQFGLIPPAQSIEELHKFGAALAVGYAETDLGAIEVYGPEAIRFAVLSGRRNAVLRAARLPVVSKNRLQVQVAFVQKQQPLAAMVACGKGLFQAVNRLFFGV